LAAKVPSVFTLSGISREFVVDGENGLVVPFKDAESVYFAMKRILDDSNLREKLIKGGVESVIRKFTVMSMMQALYKVYED
jgi:glycosyltransferase involved in cell wall biosynthesis